MPTPDSLFPWHKTLHHAMQTRNVVILHKNIRDRYMCPDGQHFVEVGFDELLTRLLTAGYGPICRYDPYSKAARLLLRDGKNFTVEPVEEFGVSGLNATVDATIPRLLADMTNRAERRTWLLKQMHNTLPFRNSYPQEEGLRLAAFQNMIEQMAPSNRLILCYLSEAQVPVELAQQFHRVTFVGVPLPDYEERRCFWTYRVEQEMAGDLAKLTEGMALSSLQRLVDLARTRIAEDAGGLNKLRLLDWERIVSLYKFGEVADPYAQITPRHLDEAWVTFTEREGIQGQEHAVGKSIEMLWKARTNVQKLLRADASTGPRGTLFFCGPTGTGKTMLAKKIAKFVFGTEDAFHRIDMSEYTQDFTVSRLIGAPPGYVGHEAGGVLSNAMLEKPFSVVLLDEIEKAHPRVFDLLLQILSDGRLTDSRGQTVFFSQAIIIFTSNLGCRASESAQLAEARQSGDPERVREHFLRAVRHYFRYEISRPELLNRLGNNIVPFAFLDQGEILNKTICFYLRHLKEAFDREYASRHISLLISEEPVSDHLAMEYGQIIKEFGGRAVLNTLDDVLLPHLAHWLLKIEMSKNKGPITLRIDVGYSPEGRQQIDVHT